MRIMNTEFPVCPSCGCVSEHKPHWQIVKRLGCESVEAICACGARLRVWTNTPDNDIDDCTFNTEVIEEGNPHHVSSQERHRTNDTRPAGMPGRRSATKNPPVQTSLFQ